MLNIKKTGLNINFFYFLLHHYLYFYDNNLVNLSFQTFEEENLKYL